MTNAASLERQYPKGKFFAVIRNPIDRIPSFINLMKVLLEDGPGKRKCGLFPATWKVIRDYSLSTQIPYCEQEMLFYKEPADNKLAIPFTTYVNNLCGTLQHVYSFCGIPIPADVVSSAINIQHTKHDYTKHKANYKPKFNKTLASLGVNKEKLRERLSEYIEWMNSIEDHKEAN